MWNIKVELNTFVARRETKISLCGLYTVGLHANMRILSVQFTDQEFLNGINKSDSMFDTL